MVEIIFESHATTLDNATHISSGWYDVELSELGIQQARELGERYQHEVFDAIFCSDLQRSYRTGEIAFGDRDFKIIRDDRLRECDYGDLTRHPSSEVEPARPLHIFQPFPNGESYEQTNARMKRFLVDLSKNYQSKRVMIIGHRATQYGLESLINNVPLEKAVSDPWHWQPGWKYTLENI